MTVKARPDADLNEILNMETDGQLVVELPHGCVFRQKVLIKRDNLLVLGNGSTIVWNDHNGMRPGFGTGASATLTVSANHTEFRGLVVENDFDYLGNSARRGEDTNTMMGRQAVAVYTRPEYTDATFIGCTFRGWQDTLFADGMENRFEDCTISGNIDFIFGRSHAVFENCTVISRGEGFVTAPSTPEEAEKGLCFRNCNITCTDSVPDGSVYLARPWHPSDREGTNSYVSFENCRLGRHISADLWTTMWDKKGHNHLPSENRFHIDASTVSSQRISFLEYCR